MASNAPAIPPGIGAVAAPLLLGYLLNLALYGALSVQVYIYFLAFPRDRLPSKLLVYGVFLLETAQTLIAMHDCLKSFATGFGNLEELGSVQLVWLSVPTMSGIVSCTVQLFFAYRIWLLSKSKTIAIVVSFIALLQGSSAVAQGVQAVKLGELSRLQSEAFISCAIWLAGSAICDVIIAIAMVYYLSKCDTSFKETRASISRLIRLTVETGTLTAVFATVDIILFLAFPHNDYHVTPALTLAKLYSNTLIVVFNSRVKIVGGRTETSQSVQQHVDSSFTTSRNHDKHTQSRIVQIQAEPGIGIKVQQEVWRDDIPLNGMEAIVSTRGAKQESFGHF